jgi:hypothetical protein
VTRPRTPQWRSTDRPVQRLRRTSRAESARAVSNHHAPSRHDAPPNPAATDRGRQRRGRVNAVAESFWESLKRKRIQGRLFATRAQLDQLVQHDPAAHQRPQPLPTRRVGRAASSSVITIPRPTGRWPSSDPHDRPNVGIGWVPVGAHLAGCDGTSDSRVRYPSVDGRRGHPRSARCWRTRALATRSRIRAPDNAPRRHPRRVLQVAILAASADGHGNRISRSVVVESVPQEYRARRALAVTRGHNSGLEAARPARERPSCAGQ